MSDVSDFTQDSGLPDPDTNGARRLLRDPPVSKETIYRLGKRGEMESYLVAGCRVWRRASIFAYIERQRAAGSQFPGGESPAVQATRRNPQAHRAAIRQRGIERDGRC